MIPIEGLELIEMLNLKEASQAQLTKIKNRIIWFQIEIKLELLSVNKIMNIKELL